MNFKRILKWIFGTIVIIVALLFIVLSRPQVKTPAQSNGFDFALAEGWSEDNIKSAIQYLENASFVDAFVALDKDQLIFSFGNEDQLINLHSLRKPIISLLIGIAQDKGLLSIEETIGSLGITEHGVEFTEVEQSAKIRDLLMARSGIYLDADAQPDMESGRPARGQYKPGEFYYYNNFDFNVLGTVLKVKTGMSYEQCLFEWIALPLGMQEFQIENVVYGSPMQKVKTLHPAYKTWMSARDLARIGSMIAQGGEWQGRRIVSKAWLKESMYPYHQFSKQDQRWPISAYAYLWGVDEETNNIWGTGYGGQMLMIDTTHQLVLVQRHFTGNSILSQGRYLMKNTQRSQVDLMQVWYLLLRSKDRSAEG